MAPAPPETQARHALIASLQDEFATEQIPVESDKLHGSIGHEGPKIGVYPDRTSSSSTNRYVSEIEIVVQFYDRYTLKVDPKQKVSPDKIESYADRFRRKLAERTTDPRTGSVWYFTLERIDYPDDPTGNKTRFEARLRARGNNTALVETVE